jgi:hypothetical protein
LAGNRPEVSRQPAAGERCSELIVSLPDAHRALDLAVFGIGVPGYSSPLGDIEPHLDAQMECSALGRPRVQENVAIPLSRFSFAAEKNG